MVKRTDLAWGELRTDSGVLLKAGTVDPDSRWFTDGQHIDMTGACRMVIILAPHERHHPGADVNKYAALGLAVEANDGKTVLVITGGLTHSSAARGWLAESSIKPDRIIRTNGKAAVEYASGGRVDFRSKRQDVRGMAPDIVFVDSDTELTIDEWDQLRPMRGVGAHVVRA